MMGFGRCACRHDSGHSGESLATGSSPRNAEMSVWILPGHADFGPILSWRGPHRLDMSCLCLKRRDKLGDAALAEVIMAGLPGSKKPLGNPSGLTQSGVSSCGASNPARRRCRGKPVPRRKLDKAGAV
jgi:hypothetical protein